MEVNVWSKINLENNSTLFFSPVFGGELALLNVAGENTSPKYQDLDLTLKKKEKKKSSKTTNVKKKKKEKSYMQDAHLWKLINFIYLKIL